MFEVNPLWKNSLAWDLSVELRRQDMDGGIETQNQPHGKRHTLGCQKQVRFAHRTVYMVLWFSQLLYVLSTTL